VFSAASTAVSSMNSFLAPTDAAVRSERTLNQLRALHTELVMQVAEDKDICKEFNPDSTDDVRAKKMAAISARLKDLLASATGLTGGSASGPGGSSSSGGKSSNASSQ
jgi:hypothetical protein